MLEDPYRLGPVSQRRQRARSLVQAAVAKLEGWVLGFIGVRGE